MTSKEFQRLNKLKDLRKLAVLFRKEIDNKYGECSNEEKSTLYSLIISEIRETNLLDLSDKEKDYLIYRIIIKRTIEFADLVKNKYFNMFKLDYFPFAIEIYDLFAKRSYGEYMYKKNDDALEKQKKEYKLNKILTFTNEIRKVYKDLNTSQIYLCIQQAILHEPEFSGLLDYNTIEHKIRIKKPGVR